MKRRNFMRLGGLASVPLLTGMSSLIKTNSALTGKSKMPVNLVLDGYFFNAKEYISILQEIEEGSGIDGDFYGQGGVVRALETQFLEITGKEEAIYLPTGTMANELALRLHCDERTTILAHKDSHVYMDEGQSAERIHQKKVLAISNDLPSLSLSDLDIDLSDVGAITMENPVRRHSGTIVPFNDLKEVTSLARTKGIKSHLDGARIHLASAYSDIPVADYSALFDSVYISLYKYLGAAGGAVLAGDSKFIDKIREYSHPLGGKVFRSWSNAAVALHFSKNLNERLRNMALSSRELIKQFDAIEELNVRTVNNGTNVAFLSSSKLNMELFADEMNDAHNIWMNYPDGGEIEVHFNESIDQIGYDAFLNAIKSSVLRAK